jgi:hypothetical protein
MSKPITILEYQITSLEKRFDALEKRFDDMFSLIMSLTISNQKPSDRNDIPVSEKNTSVNNEKDITEIHNTSNTNLTSFSANRRRTLL